MMRLFDSQDQSKSRSSKSLIINYSEGQLREQCSSLSKEEVLQLVAGIESFIKDSKSQLKELDKYLNDPIKKVMFQLTKDVCNDSTIIALEQMSAQEGISSIVNRNPPLVAEYEQAQNMVQVVNNSITNAERTVSILNKIALEKIEYSAYKP